MLSPSTILRNRYRIVQLLGHGGMGAVYQAIDENLNRLVAVKEAFGSSEELRRAFRREAELLANLQHRALPKSIEHFSENKNDYFVMEYVPGNDLGELLKLRGNPFLESDVLRWADEVLAVLAYLHGKGLVHRDIKPSNIKLTQEGELFLIDFGLAKGAVGQMGTLVTSQSVRGYTPAYASLEQILGQGTDARSDIYSVGATLYHLLAGVAPVNASTRFQMIDDEEKDPLPLIQHENPHISPNVAGIIHCAMAINRKRRPESAEQMREALRSHRAEEPARKIPSAASAQPGPTQPSPTQPSPTQPGRSNPASPVAPVVATMPVSPPPKPVPAHTNRIFSVEDVPREEPTRNGGSILKPLLIGLGVILLLTGASLAAVVLKTGWAPWSDKNLYDDGKTESPSPSTANNLPATDTSPSPASEPKQLPSAFINQQQMEFVLIKPGSFLMGSASGNDDEKPVHQVTINYSFYLGKHEVTQTQWQAVMGDNPSRFRPCGDCPVESVTWEEAQNFVRKLNQLKDGYSYRLPSEAEWEYASRAGRTADNAGDINETAWHLSNAGAKTHAVGSKRPNDWGLYDMDGNVSEWCEDWSHQSYYGAPPDGRAWLNDSDQRYRVLRGGSWLTDALYLRFAARGGVHPDSRHDAFGFRVVAVPRSK